MDGELIVSNEEVIDLDEPTLEQLKAEEEAGFVAGYNGDDVKEPVVESPPAETKPDETPVSVAEAVKDQAPAPAPTAQDFAKLMERVRASEGRVGALNDELKKAAEAKAAVAPEVKAPTEAQIEKALSDDDEFKALSLEFEDWAKVSKKIDDRRLASNQHLQSQIDNIGKVDAEKVTQEIEAKLRAEFDAKFALSEANRTIENRHPGFVETINTSEFEEWRARQSGEIAVLIASDSPHDAVKALDQFQSDKKAASEQQAAKTSRLENAVAPTSGARHPAPPTQSEQEAFEEGYKTG